MSTTPRDPEPDDWPVLVTGAGGFVGGHVARLPAGAGHRVRGLVRCRPRSRPGDAPIEWILGDLRAAEARRRALRGVRGVLHAAGWVSLGRDPLGISHEINVAATCAPLDDARRAGVERFVFTSTLHTLATGTPDAPADELSAWNLHTVDSPYARTKREAERRVRDATCGALSTVVLCPGMVLGPRDPKPASTRLLVSLARASRRPPARRHPDHRCRRAGRGPPPGASRGRPRRALRGGRALPQLRRPGPRGHPRHRLAARSSCCPTPSRGHSGASAPRGTAWAWVPSSARPRSQAASSDCTSPAAGPMPASAWRTPPRSSRSARRWSMPATPAASATSVRPDSWAGSGCLMIDDRWPTVNWASAMLDCELFSNEDRSFGAVAP